MTMTEGPLRQASEGLLRRWSRRKQAAQAEPPAAADVPNLPAPELPIPELPAVESLGIASDYTAFLQKGVTAEVQRLALQRAWESDESIAGFRGMAEYAWDFNAPEYGSLWATDDVAKLLQAVLTPPEDDLPPAVAELAAEPEPSESEPSEPDDPHQVESSTEEPRSLLTAAEPVQQETYVRRHGSALPS